MTAFNEQEFIQKLSGVLEQYALAEFLTHASISGLLNCFAVLGVDDGKMMKMAQWASKRGVTIRFKATEKCTFAYKHEKKVESLQQATSFLEDIKSLVMRVDECVWNFATSWEIIAFMGVEEGEDNTITLSSHSGSAILTTALDKAPRREFVVRDNIDVNITWILQQINPEKHNITSGLDTTESNNTNNDSNDNTFNKPTFTINQKDPKCHTPRRNPDVEHAMNFAASLFSWSEKLSDYFVYSLFTAVPVRDAVDLKAVYDGGHSIFVPGQPLFEQKIQQSDEAIPKDYYQLFLSEQTRSINFCLLELAKVYKTHDKLVTYAEAVFLTLLIHMREICQTYLNGIESIEAMLFNQIKAAVGKVVTPEDFTEYLIFHNRKFYHKAYQPRPFSHVVRRPNYAIEGTITIQRGLSSIPTFYSYSPRGRPMKANINATTSIKFSGERFVHGWITQQFADSGADAPLTLVAHARQLSSYVLLLGKITSADTLDPKYGIVISNQDILRIPLILETIPAPKEFKKAVESISPEMRKFAQAYRNMQLEGTLFGICAIQIKPQLEKLLKLPPASLTHELQLTQDLLKLFAEYQIPSDLFTYDRDEQCDTPSKVQLVKEYTEKMKRMIQKMKDDELEEQKRQELERMNSWEYRWELKNKANAMSVGYVYVMSVVLVGDPGVGKSCLTARITGGPTPPLKGKPTIGVDYRNIYANDYLSKKMIIQIQEVGGSERLNIVPSFMRGLIDAFVVSFDLTDQASFDLHVDVFVSQIKVYQYNPTIVLAGLKSDLHDLRVISLEEATQKAGRNNMQYFEISALNDENVDELFKYLAIGFQNKFGVSYEKLTSSIKPSNDYKPEYKSSSFFSGFSFNFFRYRTEMGGVSSNPLYGDGGGSSNSYTTTSRPPAPRQAPPSKPVEAASPQPQPSQQPQQQPKEFENFEESEEIMDYTKIPVELERKFDELDVDGTLRPTTINIGEKWKKTICRTMLSEPEEYSFTKDDLEKERNKAFDLLDSIMNSGAITIDHASLHILIASTHCFESSLINTVVQNNVNPIEKLENSSLIVASTIHRVSPIELIADDFVEETTAVLPHLFLEY